MEKKKNESGTALDVNGLKNAVDQLQQQNRFLVEQLKKSNYEELYKRLDYLFAVVKNPAIFDSIDESFSKACAMELMSALILKDEEGAETTEKVVE